MRSNGDFCQFFDADSPLKWLKVVLGTILTELLRALNFIRGRLGPGVMGVTRRDHQQLDFSSMESVEVNQCLKVKPDTLCICFIHS